MPREKDNVEALRTLRFADRKQYAAKLVFLCAVKGVCWSILRLR